MGLYNFKKQFAPHIKSGRKRHTIRAKRKHPDKPGNPFHGYTGLRTKAAEKVASGTITRVEDIRITDDFDGAVVPKIYIEGAPLTRDECELLAYADGFDNFADMLKFWCGRLPFTGDLIHWKDAGAAHA
jgi:hypothetical protein